MAKLSNPLAFTRGPVTFIVGVVIIAVLVPLIVVQTGVPSAPRNARPVRGIDLDEAWLDLRRLTASYHPYNSRANDEAHDWLLGRLQQIAKETSNTSSTTSTQTAYIFDDDVSNLTFSSAGRPSEPGGGTSVYFEAKNIVAYIPGKEDDPDWLGAAQIQPEHRRCLLVNAHYDSVSSGYGATDDGMGVITLIQLFKYYTTSGNTPDHGIVLLFNDGEEDFLNGANVFSQHPTSKLVSSFLNLEGAGAGGRAAMFRSTDAEITKAYADSPHPWGTSMLADGFNRGLVRSQTDYVVFNGVMGLRGLDVAFMKPRARYHTNQDDVQHTSKASLWHMLSAALATTKKLSSHPLETNLEPGKTPGHQGVWFDIFGRRLVVLQMHTLFAISVTLLAAGPVILGVVMLLLYAADKLYLFSGTSRYHVIDGDDKISLGGWRGFFRFPIIFLISCAAPVALAYLLFKENQFIVHSSEWAVWSMMVGSFVFVSWFLSRMADYGRPSALTRAYGLGWIWAAWWVLLVVATVGEQQLHVSSGYFVLIFAAAAWLATLLSYLEMFSLQKKEVFCDRNFEEYVATTAPSSSRPDRPSEDADPTEEEEETNETSGLLSGRGGSGFRNYKTRSGEDEHEGDDKDATSNGNSEQEWAKDQWNWMWVLQFLVIVPINFVIVGQLAFTLLDGLGQTGPDGSSVFLVYLSMAIFTIILFSPIVPFIHRFSWHVPTFLLLVLIGTIIYNLIAFPFSGNNRLKLFFQQTIDLDTGSNNVTILGPNEFARTAILSLPSADGENLEWTSVDGFVERRRYSFRGLDPQVAGSDTQSATTKRYQHWLDLNATKTSNNSDLVKVRFSIEGKNTRACKLVFDEPIQHFKVKGQGPRDERFKPVPEGGSKEIRLWSRQWDRRWEVDVRWNADRLKNGTMHGKAVCLWSDVNQRGVLPAWDEAVHYMPDWVAVTKGGDGLLEGFKHFEV
jgi:hypothetical protein